MGEYGQVVGAGGQATGGGGSGGTQFGDPVGSLNDFLNSTSTTFAGLPIAVQAAIVVLGVILILVILRRAFG